MSAETPDIPPGGLLADLRAGFLVFLIALPLGLGIAMASGFPPVAGVLTAIVGGVMVSFLGSSRLTIKGPAAGLIVIAIGAVQELGEGDISVGYHRALAVGVAAAVIHLLGVGIGNLICGLIGGLPMISEIVRSKANIDSGARTHLANFFHGALLLVFVVAVPGLLQEIPLAALGAMLVYTGTRLASPHEPVHALHIGADQLLLFTTTLVVTLASDLLIGVGVGLLLKYALHFGRGAGFSQLFRTRVEAAREGGEPLLTLHGAAAFTSLLSVRKALKSEGEPVQKVVLDLRDVVLIDHAFMAQFHAMADELPGAELELLGVDDLQPVSAHPHAARRRQS